MREVGKFWRLFDHTKLLEITREFHYPIWILARTNTFQMFSLVTSRGVCPRLPVFLLLSSAAIGGLTYLFCCNFLQRPTEEWPESSRSRALSRWLYLEFTRFLHPCRYLLVHSGDFCFRLRKFLLNGNWVTVCKFALVELRHQSMSQIFGFSVFNFSTVLICDYLTLALEKIVARISEIWLDRYDIFLLFSLKLGVPVSL